MLEECNIYLPWLPCHIWLLLFLPAFWKLILCLLFTPHTPAFLRVLSLTLFSLCSGSVLSILGALKLLSDIYSQIFIFKSCLFTANYIHLNEEYFLDAPLKQLMPEAESVFPQPLPPPALAHSNQPYPHLYISQKSIFNF